MMDLPLVIDFSLSPCLSLFLWLIWEQASIFNDFLKSQPFQQFSLRLWPEWFATLLTTFVSAMQIICIYFQDADEQQINRFLSFRSSLTFLFFFFAQIMGFSMLLFLAVYFVSYYLMWWLFNKALHFHFTIFFPYLFSLLSFILFFFTFFSFSSVSIAYTHPFQCHRYILNIILSHLFGHFSSNERIITCIYPYAIHSGSRVIES